MERFCEVWGDFVTIYALSCGEKLSPKSIFVRNNDKYEVCIPITYLFLCIMPFVMLVYLFCSTKGLGGEGRERELPRKWVHRKMLRVMFQNWSAGLNLVFPAKVIFGTQMRFQKIGWNIIGTTKWLPTSRSPSYKTKPMEAKRPKGNFWFGASIEVDLVQHCYPAACAP